MIFFPVGMTTVCFIPFNIQSNTLAIRAPCMWEIPFQCSNECLSRDVPQ